MASPLLSAANWLQRRLFHRLAPEYRKQAAELASRSFEEVAYLRLKERGFVPAGIVDVGAYEGNWTRLARGVFGAVPTLMVEAQEAKRPFLDRVIADLPGVCYVNTLLGANAGETVTFYEMETGSSFFPEQSNAPRTERQLTMRTLDDVAVEALPGLSPLFLKIDVQGAELQVLAGAAATLDRCELVQLEVALLPYNKGAPTMLEVVTFMDAHGFVPFDVSGFSRPNGVDLVQIDLLFARRDSSLRPTEFTF